MCAYLRTANHMQAVIFTLVTTEGPFKVHIEAVMYVKHGRPNSVNGAVYGSGNCHQYFSSMIKILHAGHYVS